MTAAEKRTYQQVGEPVPGKIVWNEHGDVGTAPNGQRYVIQSEGARGDRRHYELWLVTPGGGHQFIEADSYNWPTLDYCHRLAQRHYDGRLRA